MPVILLRAILSEKEDHRGVYRCPPTSRRSARRRATTPGSGYIFMMQLKTKQPAAKWSWRASPCSVATD